MTRAEQQRFHWRKRVGDQGQPEKGKRGGGKILKNLFQRPQRREIQKKRSVSPLEKKTSEHVEGHCVRVSMRSARGIRRRVKRARRRRAYWEGEVDRCNENRWVIREANSIYFSLGTGSKRNRQGTACKTEDTVEPVGRGVKKG